MSSYLETINTRSGYLCADTCQWCKVYGQKSTILSTSPLVPPKGLGSLTPLNIWIISWRSDLLVEETWVYGEDHRPAASQWQTSSGEDHRPAASQWQTSSGEDHRPATSQWQTSSRNVSSSISRFEWDSNSQR